MHENKRISSNLIMDLTISKTYEKKKNNKKRIIRNLFAQSRTDYLTKQKIKR